MAEIEMLTIQDICADIPYSTQIGPFGKALTPEDYTDSGVPLLRGINVNSGRFFDDGFVFVSEEIADSLEKYVCRAGEVILVHKGTIGQIGIIPEKTKFSRYLMGNSMLRVVVDKQKMLPEFLYYWMCSNDAQWYLQSRLSTVGVPQLHRPLDTLRKLPVPNLSIKQQQRILQPLTLLDSLIENNANLTKCLNEYMNSLFRSWFVEFDAVKTKAEGKKPYGMDAETAALFPDSFEDSELGPIPTGWRIGYLADLCDIQRGFSYTGASLCEQSEGIAMINLASFVEGGGYKHTGLKYISSEYNEKFYIKQGDVFIATVDLTPGLRVVGSPLIAPSSLENESIFSQDLLRLRIKTGKKIGYGFLFHWLKIRRGILKQWSSGTTVSRFPINALNRYPVLIPPGEILQRFENIFDNAQKFFDLYQTKMTYLCLTRDSLLPRLMSGELSIS